MRRYGADLSFPVPLQIRNVLATCLGVLGRVKQPICQALTMGALQGNRRALRVFAPEFAAVALAEGELVQVTLERLFAAVLIDPAHPALEYAEDAFDGVGGHIP